jgi:hypothetical protein
MLGAKENHRSVNESVARRNKAPKRLGAKENSGSVNKSVS